WSGWWCGWGPLVWPAFARVGAGWAVGFGGGQQVVGVGGPQPAVNRVVQALCHGHACGRCRVRRRALVAILAGTLMILRLMVAVVARASAEVGPVQVAAARVRLNAMTARTSQAAFAQNFPEGR